MNDLDIFLNSTHNIREEYISSFDPKVNKITEEPEIILLDDNSFACLVSGGLVHVGKIRIALKNITYETMLEAIDCGYCPREYVQEMDCP